MSKPIKPVMAVATTGVFIASGTLTSAALADQHIDAVGSDSGIAQEDHGLAIRWDLDGAGDHAVTGGYPVIATVLEEDIDIAAQLPPGARSQPDRRVLARGGLLAFREGAAAHARCAGRPSAEAGVGRGAELR